MKSQLTIALLTCLLSALAQGTTWKISFDTKWRFNCIFPGTDISSGFMRGEECGGFCERNVDCNHFIWHNGTCFLRRGCVREGDEQFLRGVGTVCGFLMSRNQDLECRISKTEIAIIAVVVLISIFIIVMVIIVAKIKKMCCFRPRERDPNLEAVNSLSNSATSTRSNCRPENDYEIDYSAFFDLPKPTNKPPEIPRLNHCQYIPNF